MAIARTTLAAALSATDLTLKVTSATGIAAGMGLRIDDEFIGEILSMDGTTAKVRGRGWEGTAGVAHDVLAPVTAYTRTGTNPDFASVQIKPGAVVPEPPDQESSVTVGQNGTLTIPANDAMVYLTKATALALTLPAPSKAEDGRTLTFVNTTAAAHVITATGLINDGITGGGKNTATFGAFVGASLVLKAVNGSWYTIGTPKVVTIA